MVKTRIAAVSYINTHPFLAGFRETGLEREIDLHIVPPARCAEMLDQGLVDIALCPVGALPGLGEYSIISDYCIGCDGPVRTVALYSQKPLELTRIISLDEQSRTSNLLIQVINSRFWKLDIDFIHPNDGRFTEDRGDGHLRIGDKCFQMEGSYPYVTDLGEEWKKFTGLPFAFACWVTKGPVEKDLEGKINAACAKGLSMIGDLQFDHPMLSDRELRTYLRKNIDFLFDGTKRLALDQFLVDIGNLQKKAGYDTPQNSSGQSLSP